MLQPNDQNITQTQEEEDFLNRIWILTMSKRVQKMLSE